MKIHGNIFNVVKSGNGAIVELFTLDDTSKVNAGDYFEGRVIGELRTLKQNAFFHKFLNDMLEWYREADPELSAERLKRIWKIEYGLGVWYSVRLANGEERNDFEAVSTSKLSIGKFCEFFEFCICHAIDHANAGQVDLWWKRYEEWKSEHKAA